MHLSLMKISALEAENLYYYRDFASIFEYKWLLAGCPEFNSPEEFYHVMKKYHICFIFFMASSIHQTLKKAGYKHHTMIEGKYRKAYLYLFETPSFYLSASCEEGDRGSYWSFVEKDNEKSPKGYSNTEEVFDLSRHGAQELGLFLRQMYWTLIQHNKDYMNDALTSPDFLENLEKEMISE